MVRFIKQYALGILAAEVLIATVLIVGLLVPLPGMVELKIVQSGSMQPAIPVGAMVAIIPAETYAVGDVVTFGNDTGRSIPTTHRIVGTERVGGSLHYQTKGDANEEADNGLVPHSSVIGGVVATVPRLGFVMDFARSKNGFMFMVVIPAALIVLDELLTIFGAVKGMRRREDTGVRPARARERMPRRRTAQPAAPLTLQTHQAGINGYSVVLRPL